jgi:hypothetical protein
MVRIENNKLIIEIESNNPAQELQYIQEAILDSFRNYDYETETAKMTAMSLSKLLKETLPTLKQQTAILTKK